MDATEKEYWERRRRDAKTKLREIAPMRGKLKELKESYDRIFCHYYLQYRTADEKLAYEDGRAREVKAGGTAPVQRVSEKELTKEQIQQLIETLEVQLREKEGGGEDES